MPTAVAAYDSLKPLKSRRRVWKGRFCLMAMIVAIAIGCGGDGDPSGDEPPECDEPAVGWLDTLRSGFYREHRNAAIQQSGYVEADTPEGTGYYVAIEVDGVDGIAVFGTSEAPVQSDPGLIAAANEAASELSDLGADIQSDSPAGQLLLDPEGTAAAEACLA